jgi:hypothetical protein
MSDTWSQEAALKAAAQVASERASDVTVPRPVVVTLTEERHVTPKPVVVHRKVYVRVQSGQGRAAPQRQPARTATKPRPSRRVVAPAPAAPKAAPRAPKAKSKTS